MSKQEFSKVRCYCCVVAALLLRCNQLVNHRTVCLQSAGLLKVNVFGNKLSGEAREFSSGVPRTSICISTVSDTLNMTPFLKYVSVI